MRRDRDKLLALVKAIEDQHRHLVTLYEGDGREDADETWDALHGAILALRAELERGGRGA